MRIALALLLVLLAAPAVAEDAPAPPKVTRTLEAGVRLVADALLKENWLAIEDAGPKAADVKFMERSILAAKNMTDRDKQLAGMQAFIKEHGGYDGAATRQRADAVARSRDARGMVVADVDWSTVRWSRHLPIRRQAIRSNPFEVREVSFALKDADRELVFAVQMLRAPAGWVCMAGVEFRETIPASKRVDAPDVTTHPFAGLWAGIEGGPLQRDVTLWLRPMEQLHKYIASALFSQDTPKGTSVSATYIAGMTTGYSDEGGLRLQGSNAILVPKDGMFQGRLQDHPVALRRVDLAKPPKALAREATVKLRGIAAVSAPAFARVRRSSFVLDMKPGKKSAITVEIRSGKKADLEVDRWIKATLKARHTGGSIVSDGSSPPYFQLIKHKHAAMFRLVWHDGGRFGARPTIVHAYAPFK